MTSSNPIVSNALAAKNATGHDFDLAGVYAAAKKMVRAGAKHVRNYLWEIPEDMLHGADVIVRKAGGKVKVVGDASRDGFVIAEVTDPLAQALERKGVMNAAMVANSPMRQDNIQGFKDADGRMIKSGDILETIKGADKGDRDEVVGFKGDKVCLKGGSTIHKGYCSMTRVVSNAVANALRARVVTNKSRKVTEKISDAFMSVQEALAALQYAKHIITREEREENKDALDAVPYIDSLIKQCKKMANDFSIAQSKGR